jgi:hypothetical protein
VAAALKTSLAKKNLPSDGTISTWILSDSRSAMILLMSSGDWLSRAASLFMRSPSAGHETTRFASASANRLRRSSSALLSMTLASASAWAFWMVASLRASASSLLCSICFCLSGSVYCMASASPLASTTRDWASPSDCLTFCTASPSACNSAILTCFCWISVVTPIWSFSCSLSKRPSRPLAYSSGQLNVAQHHFVDHNAVGAQLAGDGGRAFSRTSSRLVLKISCTV